MAHILSDRFKNKLESSLPVQGEKRSGEEAGDEKMEENIMKGVKFRGKERPGKRERK